MTKLLFSLALLCLFSACGDGFDKEPKVRQQQNALEVDSNSINQEYLTLVNNYRHDLGLSSLTYSPDIASVAQGHSKAMAIGSRAFGHRGFSVRCRWIKNRIGRHLKCAEIIAKGQKTIESAFKAWKNSPDHLKELEDPYFTHTGLGIYKSEKGVTYWTQMLVELE